MTNAKRGRGRPKDSGIDDSAIMHGIAEMLADRPATKPMTAIKSLDAAWTDSSVRRRQRKWKAIGAPILQRAKAARIAKAREVAAQRADVLARNRADSIRTLNAGLGSAALLVKTGSAFPSLALARQVRDMEKSGIFAAAREAQKHMLALRAAIPDLKQWSRQIAEQQKAMEAFMPHTAKAFAEAARAHEDAVRLISGARF